MHYFVHLSLGACALLVHRCQSAHFKAALLSVSIAPPFKANNYYLYMRSRIELLQQTLSPFSYFLGKKVGLKLSSNVKLHYQNTFVIEKMYRFSITPTICGGLKKCVLLENAFYQYGTNISCEYGGTLMLTALNNFNYLSTQRCTPTQSSKINGLTYIFNME